MEWVIVPAQLNAASVDLQQHLQINHLLILQPPVYYSGRVVQPPGVIEVEIVVDCAGFAEQEGLAAKVLVVYQLLRKSPHQPLVRREIALHAKCGAFDSS